MSGLACSCKHSLTHHTVVITASFPYSGLVIIFILSFGYILLLRCLAGPLVFLAIGLSLLLITASECTHTHYVTMHRLLPLNAVAVFSYYQYYCFQDTASLFNRFNAATNETILSFINTTDIQAVANLICTETEVLREFINTQLPWFEYQEYTWLAVGELLAVSMLIRCTACVTACCRSCSNSGATGSHPSAHCTR